MTLKEMGVQGVCFRMLAVGSCEHGTELLGCRIFY